MKLVVNNLSTNLHFLFISALAILTTIEPLLLVVGFMIVVEFIFGISRSIKLYGFNSITSRKMGNTLSKMLLYNLTVISVYLLEQYIIQTGLPLAKLAAGMICLVEIKSIDESFSSLFGWSFWEKIKNIISRGSSTTKDIMDEVENEEVKEKECDCIDCQMKKNRPYKDNWDEYGD